MAMYEGFLRLGGKEMLLLLAFLAAYGMIAYVILAVSVVTISVLSVD